MTTPSDSPPPSDPENSADPSNDAPDAQDADSAAASSTTPAEESTTDAEESSTETAAPPSPTESAGSASGIPGPAALQGVVGLLQRNLLVVGIVAAVVVVVVIVVVLLAAGVFGGGGGPSDPEDYVLDDTATVAIANVAEILETPDIPAQLAGFGSLGFPNVDPVDSAAWIEAWDAEWADDFPWVWDAIGLEDISTAVLQEDADGRDLVWMFFGLFAFEDVRESLEDAGRESDTYRDFETWGDDVALLEDKGIIMLGPSVEDVLKALDTERGFVDDASVLKQILQQSDGGLASKSTSTCTGTYFQPSLTGCDAVLEVVTGGDTENTTITGTYLFGSESRAETGVEDIEDAIDGQDTYDADLNEINTDGMLNQSQGEMCRHIG